MPPDGQYDVSDVVVFKIRKFAALAHNNFVPCSTKLLLVMRVEVPAPVGPNSHLGVVMVARDAHLVRRGYKATHLPLLFLPFSLVG